MILEDASIVDLVDTIEYQLKQYAKAEARRAQQHRLQPPAIASFYTHIQRLSALLAQHMAPEEQAEPSERGGVLPSAALVAPAPGARRWH